MVCKAIKIPEELLKVNSDSLEAKTSLKEFQEEKKRLESRISELEKLVKQDARPLMKINKEIAKEELRKLIQKRIEKLKAMMLSLRDCFADIYFIICINSGF